MKIVKQGKLLPLALVMLLLLTGCKNKSDLLVKTWRLQGLSYSTSVPEEKQAQVDRVVEEMRHSFRITYFADGTYLTHINGMDLKGSWKLNWNSSKITAKQDNGNIIDYTIEELTADNLKFKADDGHEEMVFDMVPDTQGK
jgi:major membrane immunogen (membrane-anchored lipoprotein)